MSHVLAFASGKGGTGKTVVSLATAQLLAATGKRVVVYDADASTRGLTHYLSAAIDTSRPGLADASSEDKPQSVSLMSELGELVVYPMVGRLDVGVPEPNIDNAVRNLRRLLRENDEIFDYQLVDLQAGITPFLDSIYTAADTTLVVTEADPVSIAAVAYLRRHLDRLGRRRVGGIVNRALPGEEQYFESLTDYASDIKWTGVLPLDPDVRRAFFRRQLPIKRGSGDPFALSLIDSLKRNGSPLDLDLQQAAGWVQAPGSSSASDYKELVEYRDQLEIELADTRLQAERVRFLTSITASLATLSVGVVTVLAVQESIPSPFAISTGAIGVVIAALSTAYTRFRMAAVDQVEVEGIRRQLGRVEEQLKALEVHNSRISGVGF
jgi:cellulose biosynthesis protein BcsQ